MCASEPQVWLMCARGTYGHLYSLRSRMLFEAARVNRPRLTQVLPRCPLTLEEGGRFKSNRYPGGRVLKNSGGC